MAIELAYNEAYATASEANDFLVGNETWKQLSTPEKEDALLWSRYYLDDNFDCYLSSIDTIPEELKYSNSLLAVDYATEGTLYKTSTSGLIKKSKVKAGDVETEKEYFEDSSANTEVVKPASINKVKGLLGPICRDISGSGTVSLVRA